MWLRLLLGAVMSVEVRAPIIAGWSVGNNRKLVRTTIEAGGAREDQREDYRQSLIAQADPALVEVFVNADRIVSSYTMI
jgi:hypothetical protein